MKHIIPHDLDLPTALKATHRALEAYKVRFDKYHPEATWLSETRAKIRFHAKGMKIEGDFEVTPREVVLVLDVPFLLKPFQGKAVEVVDREVRFWIAKARAGEV